MNTKYRHNILAPYWAILFILLWGISLSTLWIDYGALWKGYILDIAGPAWNYILFRGLFTFKADNKWTRFFNPKKTFFIFVFICFSIELIQYFKLYDATYDPYDLLAYVSLLFPLFLIDSYNFKKDREIL